MLTEIPTGAPSATQPIACGSCPDCGTAVFGRTKHVRRCDDCRLEAKREKDRKAADVIRRKAGIKKVKGAAFKCERCNSDFLATSKSRQRFCLDCKPAEDLERARRRSYEQGLDSGRKRIGRVECCSHCQIDFVVVRKGNVIYCEDCSALSSAGKLPHTRVAMAAARRKRNASHPKYAINDLMRGGISKSLRGEKAGRSWTSLVPYTVEQLCAHLERQFTDGMTWENRGLNGWHVDHRLPLSSFSYTSAEDPEFQFAWALSNLQPMWGDENIRKKDQILYLI